jgi:hypothetical protein
MSKKLFGITVIDGTPYIRNLFFYDGDINISNNKILNITKIIKVDDKESVIDSTKNITFENENIIHKYDGKFHMFVNEEIDNGYYTEGGISFYNNSIASDKEFKEGFLIETILKVLNNKPSEVTALNQETPIVAKLKKGETGETNIKSYSNIEQIIDKDTGKYKVLIKALNDKISDLKKIHNIIDTEYKSSQLEQETVQDVKIPNAGKGEKKGGATPTEYKFKKIARLFVELIDLIMTVPSIFKINSLPFEYLNILFSDEISISFKDNKDQTINKTNIKPLFLDIMKIIYIDYSEIKDSKLLKLLEEKYKTEVINIDNINGKQIFELLTNNNNNSFFLHITKFKYLLNHYISNYLVLEFSDIDTVNITTWLYVSIDNISKGLDNAIDNIKILELSNNISTFKRPLDNIINNINNDKIITYLKITNHNNSSGEYNKRFEIYLNNDNRKNVALVKYKNDDYQYYDENNKNDNFKRYVNELKGKNDSQINEEIKKLSDIFIELLKKENKKIIVESKKQKDNPDEVQSKKAETVNNYAKNFEIFLNDIKKPIDKKLIDIKNKINEIENITTNRINIDALIQMKKLIKEYQKNVSNSYNDLYNLTNINNYSINGDTFNINKYDTEYLFGKFTEIFEPLLNNKNIADQMKTIKEKAIDGKPIFILGYGASGAGKTSSLIYNNKGTTDQEKQGILNHLCNYFATQEYKHLTITTKEFFVSDDKNSKQFPKQSCVVNGNDVICNNTIEFKFENEQFITNYTHTNIHKYRSKYDNKKFINITLGETLIHLIDTDRFVKATTNNPNSSRSHVLVFVNMKKTGVKDINLIVGDFAGVENKFYCDDVNTLVKFLNIKRDDKEAKQYYSTELIDNDNLNVIYGGDKNCDDDTYKKQHPIYDFSNLIIRDNLKIKNIESQQLEKVLNNVLKELFKDTTLKAFDNNSEVYKFLTEEENLEIVNQNYSKCKETIQKITSTNLKESFFYNIILGIENEDLVNTYVDNMIKMLQNMNNFIRTIEDQEIINGKSDNNIPLKQNENKNSFLVKDKYIEYNSDINKIINPLTKKILENDKIIYDLFKNGSSQRSETYLSYIKDEYNNLLKFFDKIIDTKQSIDNILTFINKKKTEIIKRINDNINNFLLNGTDFTLYTSHQHIMNNDKYDIMPIKLEINSKLFDELFNLYNSNSLKFINASQVDSSVIKNVDSINKPKYSELLKIYDHIYEIIHETHCRLDYGKQICNSRVTEGEFINQSLRDVRKTIKEIMIEKNKNNIYNSPEFIDVCLDTYCPTHESCFEQTNETRATENDDTNSIPSKIFYEICNQLGYTKKVEFYKDIIVSVLCVFNISKQANNPPPIPYIDINRFKQLYYLEIVKKYGNSGEIIVEKDKITSLISQFKKITDEINYFNTKVGDLLEKDEYINTKKLMDTLLSESNKPEIIINEYNRKTIEDFINLIDNSNAVSAIGTLEFVDQIAKFNAVNTICSNNSPYLSSDENYIKLSNNLKELYSK